MVKHFFKTLIIFAAMILVGLIGVFLVSYFDKDDQTANTLNTQTGVAK